MHRSPGDLGLSGEGAVRIPRRRGGVGGLGRTLAVALLTLAATATATAAHAQTVIYLVRHAEKSLTETSDPPIDMAARGTSDPHLDMAGRDRAQALLHVLEEAGITKVMSTDTKRTRETVAPLAEKLGLPVEIYDAGALPAFAEQLRKMSGRILVVGHSNTTPELVRLLGGDPGSPINEDYEYDRLYQVVINADGSVVSTLLRYGAISIS